MIVSVLPWTFLRTWARNLRSATHEPRENVRSESNAPTSVIRQFEAMMAYNANLFTRGHETK